MSDFFFFRRVVWKLMLARFMGNATTVDLCKTSPLKKPCKLRLLCCLDSRQRELMAFN